ncbi:hypothetical protein ACIHFC_30650 [Streptomyces sp. NPDC052013]|uniref:hypothetical protein n=1 Tax=Streptomyces sp. NPDC052013 TaxID=3365679 RepID=UPI0037D952C8
MVRTYAAARREETRLQAGKGVIEAFAPQTHRPGTVALCGMLPAGAALVASLAPKAESPYRDWKSAVPCTAETQLARPRRDDTGTLVRLAASPADLTRILREITTP